MAENKMEVERIPTGSSNRELAFLAAKKRQSSIPKRFPPAATAEKKTKVECIPMAASLYMPHSHGGATQNRGVVPPTKDWYLEIVRHPPAQHFNANKKLRYTVWQTYGYDHRRGRSYLGAPGKAFNSSYASLDDANERAEFVFYFQNPWGLQGMADFPSEDTYDERTKDGCQILSCVSDAYQGWTVWVVSSNAFRL
jgi:hypothetical protein